MGLIELVRLNREESRSSFPELGPKLVVESLPGSSLTPAGQNPAASTGLL